MPVAATELAERLGRLAERVEAMLVSGRANVRYLTGFTGSNGWALWHRGVLTLLTDPRYGEQAAVECPTAAVRVCSSGLASGLADLVGDAEVGFEPDHVLVSTLAELRRECPPARFVERQGLVENLRMSKSAAEIASIRHALWVAEEAARGLEETELRGRTESEVAADLDHACRLLGASEMAFETIVAAGSNAARPHARPGHRRVDDALLQLDWGCRVDGYCSDISRVVAPARPSARWRDVHAAVEVSLLAACDAIRAGVKTASVDAVARGALEERGLARYFLHGLGHGVGIEVHEAPRLSARSAEVLQAGMVLTVEPGVYLPGEGGLRLENLVVVRDGGCEVLNALPLAWGGWNGTAG